MAEILRDIGASICIILIGMNIAFAIHDRRPIWIWFMVGKSLLALYIAVDLWETNEGVDWKFPLAFLGVSITALSLSRLVKYEKRDI